MHTTDLCITPARDAAEEHAARSRFASRAEAARALSLDPDANAEWRRAVKQFPMRWPRDYLALATAQGEGGPLWRMGRPEPAERRTDPGDLADPVGEGDRSPVPFVIRKHLDRAVLLITGRCHFYCRFCFRRATPAAREPSRADLTRAIDYLASDASLQEVILSGGDPLVWSDRRLGAVVRRLAALPHLTRLRVHSRAPVHYPERITATLITALTSRLTLRVVTHFNHPSELTAESRRALARFVSHGVPLLNQAVLLRGVNDDAGVLADLFRSLLSAGVRPHYLHHPDRAPGNAAFRLTLARGRAIYGELRQKLPTTALPRYVVDLPTGHGKVPVDRLRPLDGGRYRWEDGDRGVEFADIPTKPLPATGAGR